MATPLIVADTVFVSATVELSVPVVTPLPLVAPGCVRVTPPAGLAPSTTDAPEITLPNASRAVTVIVAALKPVLAVMLPGAAATVDCAAEGAPGVPVALIVTGLPVRPLAVAVSV